MGYKKSKSIVYQVKERICSMSAMGQSKFVAKIEALHNGNAPGGHIDYGDRIFSYRTQEVYLDRCCRFAKWARENHNCKNIEDARQYADDYLSYRLDQGFTAPTVKLDRAAIAKLYGEHAEDFRSLPIRHRSDIKRGRSVTQNSSEFSEIRHPDLIAFTRACGLRRSELEKLRIRNIHDMNDTIQIEVLGGKGGKDRIVSADPDYYDFIRNLIRSADPDERICNLFDGGSKEGEAHIPKRAPMHSYRRDYAQKMYARIARDINDLQEKELFRCKMDMYGCVFDRKALKEVSEQLGHSRVCVIAEHYMR